MTSRNASPRIQIRIETSDFDVGAEINALYERSDGTTGAVVSFIGLVRDRLSEEIALPAVTGLFLEHYPGMTEASIRTFTQIACDRWPLTDVVIVHRVGLLAPSAQIVYVQVASAHRSAAFAGAQFLMDYLKTDAVLWKREERDGDAHWVEPTQSDQERRKDWQIEKPNDQQNDRNDA